MLSKAGILQSGYYFIVLLRIDSPFQGHTASALLQRASSLFDFLRKSHCRSNAARDRAQSDVDTFYQ